MSNSQIYSDMSNLKKINQNFKVILNETIIKIEMEKKRNSHHRAKIIHKVL